MKILSFDRLRGMLRTKKICEYLLDCIKEHNTQMRSIERPYNYETIYPSEFLDYVSQKEPARDSNQISTEIQDRTSDGFIDKDLFGVSKDMGSKECIGLSSKGRKLVTGNFIKRWAYFFQFAWEEHSNLYTFLLGGGVFTVIGVITGVFHRIVSYLSAIFH